MAEKSRSKRAFALACCENDDEYINQIKPSKTGEKKLHHSKPNDSYVDKYDKIGFHDILTVLKSKYSFALQEKRDSNLLYIDKKDHVKSHKQAFREMTYKFHGTRLSERKIKKLTKSN